MTTSPAKLQRRSETAGQRRDLSADQRYLIWKYCHEQGDAWQKQHEAIADKANQKRSGETAATKRSQQII
jgi:hypothetical protein